MHKKFQSQVLWLRWLDSQEDLLLENQTLLDNINIITLVDMNDDKHNDVWVSCFHGNSTNPLITVTEKKHQVTRARNICLQIMFTMVNAMT